MDACWIRSPTAPPSDLVTTKRVRQRGFVAWVHEEILPWDTFARPGLKDLTNSPTDYYSRTTVAVRDVPYRLNYCFKQSRQSIYLNYLEDALHLPKRDHSIVAYFLLELEIHSNSFWPRLAYWCRHRWTPQCSSRFRIDTESYNRVSASSSWLSYKFVQRSPSRSALLNEFVLLQVDILRISKIKRERLAIALGIREILQNLTSPLNKAHQIPSSLDTAL